MIPRLIRHGCAVYGALGSPQLESKRITQLWSVSFPLFHLLVHLLDRLLPNTTSQRHLRAENCLRIPKTFDDSIITESVSFSSKPKQSTPKDHPGDAKKAKPLTRHPDTGDNTLNDFTLIPKLLDAQLEEHDLDGALKSVVIKTDSQTWRRYRQENLLSSMQKTTLFTTDIQAEKKKAMDLLDAISRSGSLAIDAAELHVIVGVAHVFAKSIIAMLFGQHQSHCQSRTILAATGKGGLWRFLRSGNHCIWFPCPKTSGRVTSVILFDRIFVERISS